MRKRGKSVALGTSFTLLAANLAACSTNSEVTYCGNEEATK